MAKTPVPSRLYKYQPFNTQTLANLKQASIWFSAPINLNDPYDCALAGVDPDKLSDSDFQAALDYVLRRRQIAPKLKAEMCPDGTPTPQFRETLVNSLQDAFEWQRKIRREQRGIACFSEHFDDIMMWSHYADGHRGFCLEFDTLIMPFSTAKQVSYRDTFPSVPVNLLFADHAAGHDDSDNELLLDAFVLTKAPCWSYEREWRVMHMEASKLYTYGYHALTGLYFGAAMPNEQKEIISLVLHGAPTQFHEMLRDDRSFRLHSRPVTYTPYVYQPRQP